MEHASGDNQQINRIQTLKNTVIYIRERHTLPTYPSNLLYMQQIRSSELDIS